MFANANAVILALFLAACMAGCTLRAPSYRAHVDQEIQQRTGHGLSPETIEPGSQTPAGVSLSDGLTEEEAVGIALWNNPAFQADMAQLGLSRAELVQSGLLRNPVMSLLFPVGPKQLEMSANWAIEAIWQRPRRIAAARLDLERTAESLISNGLDLVRDARIAYWEAVVAERRALLAEESSALRGRIAELVEFRLRAGDVSELESFAARTERDVAQEQAGRSKNESAIAKERLRSILGLGPKASGVASGLVSGFEITPVEREVPALPEVSAVVARALASRPDLRAIELGLEAARERVGLDRWSYLNATVVVDANAKGTEGFEAGPGLQGSIPIFDRNQGLIQRADAAVEKATKDQLALKHRIELEVTESYARVIQARESLDSWRRTILPSLTESVGLTEQTYNAGEVSYLFYLESTRQRLAARGSELDAQLSLRRALVSLDRSVGANIDIQP